jgi:hypothetical protein
MALNFLIPLSQTVNLRKYENSAQARAGLINSNERRKSRGSKWRRRKREHSGHRR